jgi:pimeloyl-ACP methyl ester carboxylesterase
MASILDGIKVSGGNEAAIIFIHGFGGDRRATWQEFPKFLSADSRLSEWDIFSLGYSTRLRIDWRGIWSADPDLSKVARLLITDMEFGELSRYKALALVAHSMGGLVVQKAIVDEPDLAKKRVRHVILFGTPSNGLAKASLISFLKPSAENMAKDGPFITELREKWKALFGSSAKRRLPFEFVAVAGERDEFVPASSSIDIFTKAEFPDAVIAVAPGNHLELVKPEHPDDLCVQIVINTIVGQAAPDGPMNAARLAIEAGEFQKIVNQFEPLEGSLDSVALVQLALAYESIGRGPDAIRLLEAHGSKSTDAMGTLAGRLKRRWLVNRNKGDAERALQLYQDALRISEEANNWEQAYYHAINVAFMKLAYINDNDIGLARRKAEAATAANYAIELCAKAVAAGEDPHNVKWRLGTEGEAYLIMNKTEEAFEKYRAAAASYPTPSPRELDAMYQQAMAITGLIGADEKIADEIELIFRGGKSWREQDAS